MSKVSIVIATLNRPALLAEALTSAMAQTLAPAELLVVDDGSEPPVDATALAARFGDTVRVLRNPTPQGLAWARHQGVEAASGDYVVHLDDDDLFAPELIAACAASLDADLALDLVFIGTQGFGRACEHFNRVHPEGVRQVIAEAGVGASRDSLQLLGHGLVQALLQRVPMPFQRVLVRREAWHRVHQLRLAAYRAALGLASDAAAREQVRGTLRDSEWAVYAALTGLRAALVDRPLYLQRCDGQGGSSVPAMRRKHIAQSIVIKAVMNKAAKTLPEMQPHRQLIRQNLERTHFDAAYELTETGQYADALSHLRQSLRLGPRPGHLHLLCRLALGWSGSLVPRRA